MRLPAWHGETVAVMASGPSMNKETARRIQDWGGRTIAINNTFKLAPRSDILYSCDRRWWDRYIREAREEFTGELWTQDELAAISYGINHVPSVNKRGLCTNPGVIHQGGNSGYQAINIAYHTGATRILLFGFDMHLKNGSHWHGDHENDLHEALPIDSWVTAFDSLAIGLREEHVEVINCTPGTALGCFYKDIFKGIE